MLKAWLFRPVPKTTLVQVNVTCKFSGVFPLPSVKLTWGSFDLFADRMTADINPTSSCYEVTIHKVPHHHQPLTRRAIQ